MSWAAMTRTCAALALLALAGCAGRTHPAHSVPAGWRTVAMASDRERIRNWHDIWEKALAKATPGHAAEIAAAGIMLRPDVGLPDPAPPPGRYRCRIFKIGGKSSENPDFSVTPPLACRLSVNAEGQLRFVILEGAQRPNGGLFTDGTRREIFLGSMILTDERKSIRYGTDAERSLAGFVERIDAGRWRLVLPSPRWEAMLEVIEIAPAA